MSMEYTKLRQDILAHFPTEPDWQLHCFHTIGSTNTYAKELAANGASHGTVIVADRQTGGRGRMGRSFHSPGTLGIYLSVILRPNCTPDKLMHLTCAAAVAMCDAVEAAAGIRPGIKWTNDLVFGTRKLGGILTELALDAKTGLVRYAVIGIGINCCQTPADFPEEISQIAASLSMVTGKDIDRSTLAAAMIAALMKMDAHLLTNQDAIMTAYRANCITLGKQVSVVRGDTAEHATALDVDDLGALIVRFEDGRTEAVNSGEVSIRGMYGYV